MNRRDMDISKGTGVAINIAWEAFSGFAQLLDERYACISQRFVEGAFNLHQDEVHPKHQ
jgi:hypothetical protein